MTHLAIVILGSCLLALSTLVAYLWFWLAKNVSNFDERIRAIKSDLSELKEWSKARTEYVNDQFNQKQQSIKHALNELDRVKARLPKEKQMFPSMDRTQKWRSPRGGIK